MSNRFYKSENTSNFVIVKDFGLIDLSKLPIRIHKDRKGIYEICWVRTKVGDREDYVLSECGGNGMHDYGGRSIEVLKVL